MVLYLWTVPYIYNIYNPASRIWALVATSFPPGSYLPPPWGSHLYKGNKSAFFGAQKPPEGMYQSLEVLLCKKSAFLGARKPPEGMYQSLGMLLYSKIAYFVIFQFNLFYLILNYFILFYVILFYFIIFYSKMF